MKIYLAGNSGEGDSRKREEMWMRLIKNRLFIIHLPKTGCWAVILETIIAKKKT